MGKSMYTTNQRGAALFVALILLAVLMIIGVTAVRNSTFQEKMATNLHQNNWVFSVADSGIGAFNEIANAGNDLDPTHVLFRTRVAGNVSICIDADGNEAACGTKFDGKEAEVRVDIESKECLTRACFGYSMGIGSESTKCQIYKVNSEDSGNGMSEQVEWWAYQLTSFCPTN